jgi:Pentapeptide repeats (8 copies)
METIKTHRKITARWSDWIIFEGEYTSQRECVLDAVAKKIDLRGSDLRDSNLSGSDLSGSDLSGSNLRDSNLRGSNLSGSDLSGSNLSGSNLSDSNLSDSNLSDSNLSGSDLSDSDLSGSNLRGFKTDLIAEVLKLPDELENLRTTLIAGKIDGSTYSGECACLAGTIAKNRGIKISSGGVIQENGCAFKADSNSLREQWFMNIRAGHTPENSPFAKIALGWIDEAIAIRDHIRGVPPIGGKVAA